MGNQVSVIPQSALIIPVPENDSLYWLLTQEFHPNKVAEAWYIYKTLIDMRLEGGLGAVVEKRKLVLADAMAVGSLTAVKHANGRDWWLPVFRADAARYHIGLVTPAGISFRLAEETFLPIQFPEEKNRAGGQAVFSLEGNVYARVDAPNNLKPAQITVFDFDRCTGALSNQRIHILKSPEPEGGFGAGVAISPNGRYLYVFRTRIAAQYDLSVPDFSSTERVIGLWDGTVSGPFNYGTFFWNAQLGPDGRIYVGSFPSTFLWHYVDHPDRPGDACAFVPRGIEFPVLMGYGMPNHPNYRLGPLDGSPCDTLGIDNLPLARWRWAREDSLAPLQVTFTDLSAYAPTAWYWTFGDGGSSTLQHPVHTYQKPGVYTVCLVVSNAYGADTLCRDIVIEGEPTGPPSGACSVAVRPNPFEDRLVVWLNEEAGCEPFFTLFDATGRRVKEQLLNPGYNHIPTRDLPAAVYFWQAAAGGDVVGKGKVVRVF